ncbi:Transmembrane protein [Senna tora]|uniref:Transmembrane protein n=1 Tax=Senna tora TaxID=362788 RepID=A0A834X6D7_9FABA|nr:Transmembrane protein [Senna tora]
MILHHVFTIAGAVSSCAAASAGTSREGFSGELKSYVREEDGSLILKLAGGLSILIFCLEWVVLTLAFFLKYYAHVDGGF